MRLRFASTLAFALLGATTVQGLTPHLVKDINTVPLPQGSSPQGYARVGGLAFFTADDGETGAELWRSDGTAAGTFEVVDACPGECSGHPVIVARTERLAFFRAFARNGFGLVDLWVTDGSPAGTVRLAGSLLMPDSGRRSLWLAGQGLLYFAANDLVDGAELWRSDGTAAGTYEVTDLRPGFAGSEPAELTELGGRLFFRADDGQRGPALWTSDGTAEGTRLIVALPPNAAAPAGPDLLRAAAGRLFFAAPLGGKRAGLWTSDGTARGSAPLIGFRASPQAPAILDATVLGKRLLFIAVQPSTGAELWASDGTPRGTRPLTRFAPAAPFSPLSGASGRLLPEKPLGNRLVFRADDGVHGAEPWVTDGTPRGTRLLRDLCPGPCRGAGGTDDAGIVSLAVGDLLLFPGYTEGRGFELWATDGTATGTRLVRDLCRGTCSSEPSTLLVGEGEAFLLARNGRGVPQLWRSDGTSPGTVRLTSFQSPAALAGPSLGVPLGGALLFSASDGGHGRELWRSGGTAQTTRLLLDLNPEDFGGSFPTALRAAAGRAWFFADDGVHGFELWTSDGTEAGTALVHEFTPGEEPARPPDVASAAESAGGIVFLAHLAEPNFSLWRSQGTPGSTVRLTPPELRIVAAEPLLNLNGRVFFVAADAAGGEELWASDGTPEGTRRVADLAPGAAGSQPRSLTVFQNRLFFTADAGGLGRELWRSDGTAAGTVLVEDIDPRPNRGSEPQPLTVHGGLLYFAAADAEHGRELWASDGTAAGTRLAVDVVPGPVGISVTHLVSSGAHLFFSGGPPSLEQRGLWVSDGTAAGTRQIGPQMINADPGASTVPGVFDGQLFFSAAQDQVLWRSDGTEEGTAPLLTADGLGIDEPAAFQVFAGRLFLSTAGGVLYETDGTPAATIPVLQQGGPFVEPSPFELVTAGGRLLLRAWERTTGSELWALEDE
jgi:ELWxxDGT repeat protein